jgi:PAS domain S-box-containing protein
VERSPEITVLVESDGATRWVSPAAANLLGMELGELVGGPSFDLIHPADRDLVASTFSAALSAGGTAGPVAYRLRDGDGEWHPVEALMTNMLNDPAVGAVVLSIRSTEERQSGVADFDSTERYRRLLEQSPDGVFVVDENYFVTYASVMGVQLVGATSAGVVVGRPFGRFVPEDDRKSVQRGIRAVLRSDDPSRRTERTIVRDDGRRVPVEISSAAVTHMGRRAVQLVVRDIGRRRRAERQADEALAELEEYSAELRESNFELESFGATALHDLVQPFQTVFAYLLMLEDGKADSPQMVTEWAGTALRTLRRMHALLESLVARSKAGTRGLSLEVLDCNSVVAGVIDDLAPAIAKAGGQVELNPLPTVVADPAQLGELFQNLISNSLKFVRGNTRARISVSVSRDGSSWRFSVADNGIGIPPEAIDEVFLPFRRVSGDGRAPGTGLGLYTCKRIVERHGGSIWAESVPDGGARICFTIPELSQPAETA